MKELFFVTAFMAILGLVSAQKQLNTVKTADHIRVAGTKFYLIPPTNFIPAINHRGFDQSGIGAAIFVMEIPQNFGEFAKAFTKEELLSKEIVLNEREPVLYNLHPALFARLEQWYGGNDFIINMFLFGNEKATYVVKATFPKQQAAIEGDIQKSIFSVVYDSTLFVDPMESMAFTVDTEGTQLKFAKNLSGTLVYTIDGKAPTESNDHTMFIVSHSYDYIKEHDNNQKLAAIDRMKELPYSGIKIDEVKSIKVNKLSGYEILGEGINEASGIRYYIYNVMLFDNDGYFFMVGITDRTLSECLEMFRKISGTLRKK